MGDGRPVGGRGRQRVEAVELVIQSGAIGLGGEVLVLDMGEPVRIGDVAQLLAARSERRVALDYTGLRDGEKLHEVLFGSDEMDRRPVQPLISQVDVTPLEPDLVRCIDVDQPSRRLVDQLADVCAKTAPVAPVEDR